MWGPAEARLGLMPLADVAINSQELEIEVGEERGASLEPSVEERLSPRRRRSPADHPTPGP